MSLKTSPYKPANVADEPIHPAFNLGEVITFIYPDGSTRELKLYEGMFIAAMYVRRNASVAMYHMTGGQRALVMEYNDGQMRAFPALFDAMQKLLSMVKVEADEAAQNARDAMIASGGQAWPGSRQEAEATAAAPEESAPAPTEQASEAAAEGSDEGEARAGGRFRRGRR